MKHIVIVTSNNGKFEEIKRYLNQLDPSITLEQSTIDVPEYQDMDIQRIAVGKANYAWNILKKPLLIDDGGLYLEKYNQFPGAFSKYVYEGIGLEGIWLLAQDDPRAYFLNCLVYKDSETSEHLFLGMTKGHLIAPTGTMGHKQLPYRSIFIPEGYTQTIDELWDHDTFHSMHHRFKSVEKLVEFLKIKETKDNE
jgi:non-canonical purine NTP pyrophosphatase (RdgB/HAM1 family)